MDITVAIPTIPPRRSELRRAMASVMAQERSAAAVSLAVDLLRQGAPATRQRALEAVRTDWVAFLDDDDQLYPEHLALLAAAAQEHEADYVFSHPEVVGGTDPFPGHLGRAWDRDHPRQTTITVLVRTELAQAVGFHEPEEGRLHEGQRFGEDFAFTLECNRLGAAIVHVPRRTWVWTHHPHNTSGQKDRW